MITNARCIGRPSKPCYVNFVSYGDHHAARCNVGYCIMRATFDGRHQAIGSSVFCKSVLGEVKQPGSLGGARARRVR